MHVPSLFFSHLNPALIFSLAYFNPVYNNSYTRRVYLQNYMVKLFKASASASASTSAPALASSLPIVVADSRASHLVRALLGKPRAKAKAKAKAKSYTSKASGGERKETNSLAFGSLIRFSAPPYFSSFILHPPPISLYLYTSFPLTHFI